MVARDVLGEPGRVLVLFLGYFIWLWLILVDWTIPLLTAACIYCSILTFLWGICFDKTDPGSHKGSEQFHSIKENEIHLVDQDKHEYNFDEFSALVSVIPLQDLDVMMPRPPPQNPMYTTDYKNIKVSDYPLCTVAAEHRVPHIPGNCALCMAPVLKAICVWFCFQLCLSRCDRLFPGVALVSGSKAVAPDTSTQAVNGAVEDIIATRKKEAKSRVNFVKEDITSTTSCKQVESKLNDSGKEWEVEDTLTAAYEVARETILSTADEYTQYFAETAIPCAALIQDMYIDDYENILLGASAFLPMSEP